MRRTIVLLALLAIPACGAEETKPAPEAAAADAGLVLTPGDRYRYTFSWSNDAGARIGNAARLDGGVELSGELEVAVAETEAGARVLRVRLARVDAASIRVGEAEALDEEIVRELERHDVVARVDARGVLDTLWFEADAPPVFRYLATGLLAHFDLAAAESAGVRRVRVDSGVAIATYTPDLDQANVVHRHLEEYDRFDGLSDARGADGPRLEGEGSIELDRRGFPRRIELSEWSTAANDYQGSAHAVFTRVGRDRHDSLRIEIASRVAVDSYAEPDYEQVQRAADEQLAADLLPSDVEQAVAAAGRGLRPPPGFLIEAAAYVRVHPDAASELVAQLGADPPSRTLGFLADLLASAGDAGAQRALRELIDRVEPDTEEAASLLQRFAFVRAPTPATADFMLGIYRDARARGDTYVASAALHPMGSLVRRLDPTASVLARALHEELRRAALDPRLRLAAVAGLGNAAQAGDLELLLSFSQRTDSASRAAAVTALRFQTDDRAIARIVELAGDAEVEVAHRALTTLDGYAIRDDATARAVVDAVVAGAYNPATRSRLTTLLARMRDEHPEAADGLQVLAMTDLPPHESERVRRLADRAP